MIEACELTKRYGDTTAVHSLSFTIAPGTVTGFLGPNGAGKSTTMRMIMGLDRPTSGTVTVNGKPYAAHRSPLSEAGALLHAKAVLHRRARQSAAPGRRLRPLARMEGASNAAFDRCCPGPVTSLSVLPARVAAPAACTT